MLLKKTWVLVANGSMARIFDFSKGFLEQFKVFNHPATRAHAHVAEKHAITVHHEARHFAEEVSQYLDLKRKMKQFEQLHVIASPLFLGLLRNQLDRETQRSIGRQINKNLVEESVGHIDTYLRS
ncbi:MAG: host attachment protein [Myxococcaceae bacterium]